jgi:hypothetical protein
MYVRMYLTGKCKRNVELAVVRLFLTFRSMNARKWWDPVAFPRSHPSSLISCLVDFFLSFVVPKVHAKTLSIFSMFVDKLFSKSFCKF